LLKIILNELRCGQLQLQQNNMKPSIIISNFDDINNPHYAGGGAYSIHEVAKRLVNKYSLTVITSNYPLAVNTTIDGVKYIHIGPKNIGPKLGQILFQCILLLYTRKLTYDIWIENLTPPFSASLLPLFTKKPIIGLVHMLSCSDMQRKYLLPFTVIEKFALHLYNNFIVLTEHSASELHRIVPKAHITIIPNGITPLNIHTHRSSNPKYLLFLGRIEINQKGLDLLLNAFKQISIKHNIHLIIAGNGAPSEIQKITMLIRSLGLQKSTTLIGRIASTEKTMYISKASAIIVPSRFETFSMTSLEALAYGVPLVTYHIQGLKWIPSNCRIIARKMNSKCLETAIHTLLINTIIRKDVRTNGLKFAKLYAWKSIVDKYDSYIQQILCNN
jgi:phosphatidyl-myo-inositol alpha-mannosyltransferase